MQLKNGFLTRQEMLIINKYWSVAVIYLSMKDPDRRQPKLGSKWE